MQFSAKRLLAIVLAFGLVLSVTGSGFGGNNSVSIDQCESTELVFVELHGAPLIDVAGNVNAARSRLVAEQLRFRQNAQAANISFSVRYQFQDLFNGFSISVHSDDVDRLLNMPGVKNVYPVFLLPIPEVETSTEMINAPLVVESLDYDGSGVLVAVIDTGIDYNHPDLGGGWGVRVVDGWDFVGDEFNAQYPETNIPDPNPDPMDPNGHGTHVAGIIGASGQIRGVAPGVDFLALKVFGREGSTTADIVVAAMEMAWKKGADIINMSLGAAYQWPQYPTCLAADRLVNRGVVMAVSQGNNGPTGTFAGGAPSLASKVLATASFDNTHANQRVFLLPDGTPIGYAVLAHSPDFPLEGVSPEFVYAGLGNTYDDYAGLDVEGKVVMVSRGAQTFAHKALMAAAHGAAKLIIHNNAPGNFAGTLAAPGDWIPVASISYEHAMVIYNMMSVGPVTATWTDQEMQFPSPTAGFISTFSSWGPTPDLNIKPDLGAPGGSIYSTYPLALGGYATLSGTSMAAPHTAGAAALLLQAEPKLRPNQVADRLLNTAVPQNYQGMPFIEPVHRQGAGMIDIYAAVTTKAVVEPSKVALGEINEPQVIELRLRNLELAPKTFTLSHLPAIATTLMPGTPPGLWLAYAGVDMPETVTLMPMQTRVIEVTIIPTPLADVIFGGYIVITPENDEPVLSVPYLGVTGDYLAHPVLSPGAYGFPWLTYLEDGTYYKVDELTINPADGETAVILYNLVRQARVVQVDVYDDAGNFVARVADIDYAPRNADAFAYFSFAWGGEDDEGIVPSGVYYLELRALKPLGDYDDPAHWETWTTGPITVVND